jgi:hypothetical protein
MSQRKGETKRQHYVPRMILRNFSADANRISLVVEGKRIDGASLRDQCYADYFYGADNLLEKSFAAEESQMAAFFGDLSPARFQTLAPDDVDRLRRFVGYQRARTRGAAEHLSKLAGAFMKNSIKGTLSLQADPEFAPEDLDLVEVRLNEAQRDAVWMAAKTAPILLDLAVKFITTDRTTGFVISDHPVVAYNQFAEHHPRLRHYPTSTGLALKGLQLFMPLSPSMTLAVFDPATYQYGGSSPVCRAGPGDVAHLNRMQAVNAHDCFYFDPDRMGDDAVRDLVVTRDRHPSLYEKHVATGPIVKGDRTASQMVVVRHPEIRLSAKLSFVRTLDGRSYERYEGPTIPVRSQELLRVAELYGQLLEQRAVDGRAERAASAEQSASVPAEAIPDDSGRPR